MAVHSQAAAHTATVAMPYDDPRGEIGAKITTDNLWQIMAATTGVPSLASACEEDRAIRPWPAGTSTGARAAPFVQRNAGYLDCITAIFTLPTTAPLAISGSDEECISQLIAKMDALSFNHGAYRLMGNIKLSEALRQQPARAANGAGASSTQRAADDSASHSQEAGRPHYRNLLSDDNMIIAIVTFSHEHSNTYIYSIEKLAKHKRVSAADMLRAIGSAATVVVL